MWDDDKNSKGYGEENDRKEELPFLREDAADASAYTTATRPSTHSTDARRRIMERILVEQAELWERLANS
jgi:hypothetical protein